MIKQGKITSWNDDKGYGFITPSSGEGQVFAHIKEFKYQARRPEVNRLVTYILSTDKQGRICAAEVTMLAAAVVEKDDQGNWVLANAYAALFLVLIILLCIFGIAPFWSFVVYLAMSLITYAFYYVDKSAEANGNLKDVYKNKEYRKDERYWEEEINYYFKVRSGHDGSAMYGKIYGYFFIDSHPGSSSKRLKFTYYLNADRTNNVEFAPGKSYFSSSPAIGAENPPHKP